MRGPATGFSDSLGKPIHVGDTVRKEVTCNQEFHGDWVDYLIELQGIIPKLSYLQSETGKKLPPGYTGCWLSECYDTKLALFACDPDSIHPVEKMLVVDADFKGMDIPDDDLMTNRPAVNDMQWNDLHGNNGRKSSRGGRVMAGWIWR